MSESIELQQQHDMQDIRATQLNNVQNDMLRNPDQYQPLMTVKGIRNKPSLLQFDKVNLIDLFTSQPNKELLLYSLLKTIKHNNLKLQACKKHSNIQYTKQFVQQLILTEIQLFTKTNNLNQYVNVDAEAVQHVNWVEILKTINNDFLQQCYTKFKWNQYNPYQAYATVGPHNNRKQKKYADLLAHDIPTLDVWRNQEIQRLNRQYRGNNTIPRWQYSMHSRNYDRSNDGLVDKEADRSSLDTPIYGYDMSNIYESIDSWTDKACARV